MNSCKSLVLFLFIGTLAVSGTLHAQIDPVMLRGQWAGTLTLKHKTVADMKEYVLNYTLSMTIQKLLEHEESGAIWWPELGCSTVLKFVHFVDGQFKFTAKPTAKSCVYTVLTITFITLDTIEVTLHYNIRNLMGTTRLTRIVPVEQKLPVQQ